MLVTGRFNRNSTRKDSTEIQPSTFTINRNKRGAIYDLEHALRSSSLSTFIADIRDKGTIEPLFEGADFVFHLAALKNLLMCESNPYEAVKTNIFEQKTSLTRAYARI